MQDEIDMSGIRQQSDFVFLVQSYTRGNTWYVVDLEAFDWNGKCDCPKFAFNFEKHLKAGAAPAPRWQCKHLDDVSFYFRVQILPKLAAAIREAQRAKMPDAKFGRPAGEDDY